MATDLVPKSSIIYDCELCDYNTSRYSQYIRHLTTEKHKNLHLATNSNKKVPKIIKNPEITKLHDCICGKNYKDRTGLWRHKKTCEKTIKTLNDEIQTQIETQIETHHFKITPKMFYDLLKQNNELQKSIIALSSKQTIGNYNNVNSNNKTFNLQVFLNETCKDAINLTDFINQITINVDDLEETGKLGYAEGISKVFIKNLNGIDLTKRPIHCCDSKRETLYFKDQDKWSKEDDQKSNIKKAIKYVANKNIQQISNWQKDNPEYNNPSSKKNDKYMQIVLNSMSGSTKEESDKNYEKIVKNIAKETVIEK